MRHYIGAFRGSTQVNGWRGIGGRIGAYGEDYRGRAAVGLVGLGANLVGRCRWTPGCMTPGFSS